MNITRRSLLAGAAGSSAAPAQAKRPNILFCIADDWSWPFSSIAGDKTAHTPNFDRIAREGVLFPHAHCVAPSCTPSRGAILTGQWFARLEWGGNLHSALHTKFDVYPDMLERAGYHVGLTGKGWGPGDWKRAGRKRNPAGPEYSELHNEVPANGINRNDYAGNFDAFLSKRPAGSPFCFWYGGHEPHRAYEKGSGIKAGKSLKDVRLPPYFPDAPEVRGDLLDYALEIEWFDTHLGRMIRSLEKAGELDNTLIAVTGDNGLPFPRCKTNLYDSGTNVPLAVRWPSKIKAGRTIQDYISLADLAPTFLEAAGLAIPPAMTARSFLDVLSSGKSGWVDSRRERVFTGRERHTQAQSGSSNGYPMRAMHTRDYLYIRNYKPDRFPAGDETPKLEFRDIDEGPTKRYMMAHRQDAAVANLFELGFGKRPGEELYDLRKNDGQLKNLAQDPKLAATKERLAKELEQQLKEWNDPRVMGKGDAFDSYEYLGR